MSDPATQSTHLRFGAFDFDLRSGELRKSGRRIRLAPRASKILAYLARHPGRVISPEELRRQAGSPGLSTAGGRVAACIRQIREALNDPAKSPRFIETHRQQGYRFRPPVQVSTDRIRAATAAGGTASSALRRAVPAIARAHNILDRALGTLRRRND